MPKDVVDRINTAVKETLALPEVKRRIEDSGSFVAANTPAEFAQQIKEELVVYKRVVDLQGLKLE
jgi:tripartite-type tricarboxylate transporter receptor subunit TctC